MKIIITESQYKLLINEQKIYSSQTEYDKAMIIYNKRLDFYNFCLEVNNLINIGIKKGWNFLSPIAAGYDVNKDLNLKIKNLPSAKKKYNNLLAKAQGRSVADVSWSFMFSILEFKSINREALPTSDVYYEFLKSVGNPKIVGFYDSSMIKAIVFAPKVQKPIKPILQEPTTAPIPKTITQTVKSEPTKTTEFTPKPDDTSVYGPSKSLIGFMRGRDFIPASGKYTVGMNKLDRELLNNKVELNKYIQSKFGAYANQVQ